MRLDGGGSWMILGPIVGALLVLYVTSGGPNDLLGPAEQAINDLWSAAVRLFH